MKSFIYICLLNVASSAVAQVSVTDVTISRDLIRQHLYRLASDSLRGRLTGTPGQYEAGLYGARVFRQHRLVAPFRADSGGFSLRQSFAFKRSLLKPYGQWGAVQGLRLSYELVPPPTTAQDSAGVLFGQNVAGLLVGTELKKEIVVISAHYDHLGTQSGQIFYGADDNASGTAAVLSIAAAFDSLARLGVRPRRSILFVLFSGEEDGLLGSRYFVENCPVASKQLVYGLNADMLGRVDEAHQDRPNHCYLIGNRRSGPLRAAARKANKQSVNLRLDRTYDDENDAKPYFYRSDHVNLAAAGVPVLFFTNGEHHDYHRPSDTADRIDYELLQKRATLIFQTAWLLAN